MKSVKFMARGLVTERIFSLVRRDFLIYGGCYWQFYQAKNYSYFSSEPTLEEMPYPICCQLHGNGRANIYYMSHKCRNISKSQLTSPTPAQLPAVAVSSGHIVYLCNISYTGMDFSSSIPNATSQLIQIFLGIDNCYSGIIPTLHWLFWTYSVIAILESV
jgi:hypothetical protein